MKSCKWTLSWRRLKSGSSTLTWRSGPVCVSSLQADALRVKSEWTRVQLCVCVCVCVRARADVRVCVDYLRYFWICSETSVCFRVAVQASPHWDRRRTRHLSVSVCIWVCARACSSYIPTVIHGPGERRDARHEKMPVVHGKRTQLCIPCK